MSPNAEMTYGLILAAVTMLAGILCFGLAVKRDNGRALLLGVAVFVIGYMIGFPIIALNEYAAGRAKYELRDNPDGTKTWQRIEVTK